MFENFRYEWNISKASNYAQGATEALMKEEYGLVRYFADKSIIAARKALALRSRAKRPIDDSHLATIIRQMEEIEKLSILGERKI